MSPHIEQIHRTFLQICQDTGIKILVQVVTASVTLAAWILIGRVGRSLRSTIAKFAWGSFAMTIVIGTLGSTSSDILNDLLIDKTEIVSLVVAAVAGGIYLASPNMWLIRRTSEIDEKDRTHEILEELRSEEGDSVTLLAPNAGFGGPNNAVECNGDWTEWRDLRFEGNTELEALEKALAAKKNRAQTLSLP